MVPFGIQFGCKFLGFPGISPLDSNVSGCFVLSFKSAFGDTEKALESRHTRTGLAGKISWNEQHYYLFSLLGGYDMSTETMMEDASTSFGKLMNANMSTMGSSSQGGGASDFDKADVVAFIGPGVEFKGVIKYQGNVRIDGHLEGEVHAEGTLYLGEQAVLSAKIQAKSVISKGQITGDITAGQKVQLLAPAVVDGSVVTPSLLVEEGVVFNGTCEMGSKKTPKPAKSREEPLPLVTTAPEPDSI